MHFKILCALQFIFLLSVLYVLNEFYALFDHVVSEVV